MIVKCGNGWRTIADCCNAVFGMRYSRVQRSYFTPASIRDKSVKCWFPKFDMGEKWLNRLAENGNVILEYDKEESGQNAPVEDSVRVTFGMFDKSRGYEFLGLYTYGGFVEYDFGGGVKRCRRYCRQATLFNPAELM